MSCSKIRTDCAVEFQKINDGIGEIKGILNGDEGTQKRIKALETYKSEQDGKSKFVHYAIGSGWALTIILFVLAAFHIIG